MPVASLSMGNAKPPVFFGDRGDLAWAIGAPIRNEEAAQKTVQEVIKELRRDGAIVWSEQARAGVKASYARFGVREHRAASRCGPEYRVAEGCPSRGPGRNAGQGHSGSDP